MTEVAGHTAFLYMDHSYLKNKTAFSKAISKLVKECRLVDGLRPGQTRRLPDDIQRQLLDGYRKFMPHGNRKRSRVESANAIGIALNYTGHSFVLVLQDESGSETTVSKTIRKDNYAKDLAECCRGAVHRSQILPYRRDHGRDTDEVDHRNRGGFRQLVTDWATLHSKDEIRQSMVFNDPRTQAAANGFHTLREPLLKHWQEYHRRHAQLQCISAETHRGLTNKRVRVGE